MISYILLGIPIVVLLIAAVILFKRKKPTKKQAVELAHYDEKERKLYMTLEDGTINVYEFTKGKLFKQNKDESKRKGN